MNGRLLDPEDLFTSVFAEEGNLTNKELTVIGSAGSPIDFIITPPDNKGWEVTRINFKIRDDNQFTAENFGSIAGGLTNGIQLFLTVGGQEVNLNEIPISTNADLGLFAHLGGLEDYGAGDNFLLKTWETPVIEKGISILEGQKLIIRIQDDLSSLNSFQVSASGRQLRQPSGS